MKNKVLITRAKFKDGRAVNPTDEGELGLNHQAWVGNDTDGWTEIPMVTNVDIPLRQGQLPHAVITVIFPQVDLSSERPGRGNEP